MYLMKVMFYSMSENVFTDIGSGQLFGWKKITSFLLVVHNRTVGLSLTKSKQLADYLPSWEKIFLCQINATIVTFNSL